MFLTTTNCHRFGHPEFRLDADTTRVREDYLRNIADTLETLVRHDHNDPSNLECASLYAAFLHQPAIQGFISFPIGSTIILDHRNGLRILRDGQELPIQPNTLLSTWRQDH
jgi:hypothetical protein